MLDLYYSPTCPYCSKVIQFFEDNHIDFMPKDVTYSINYDDLMTLGKIAQVPFLVDTDNDIRMYESDKIIEYAKSLNKKIIYYTDFK